MAANIFGLGSKSRPEDDVDNLLGMRKSQGMTDRSFSDAGRAPVDELFAGRNSAWIDDAAWDELEGQARDELAKQRGAVRSANKPNSYIDDTEGGADDQAIRRAVTQETGLHMYPGQGVKGSPKDSIFMYEFDDSGATLADGWREGEELPTTLGGILNHEELYKHYPELQDLPLTVEALEPRLMGSYGGVSDTNGLGRMRLNSSMADKDIMDTVLHETQHYIQRLENWPGGGGHSKPTSKNFAGWHPERFEGWSQVAENNQDDLENVRDQFNQEAYENISGEILARDVEDRFNTRNSLNAVIDDYNNPNGQFHSLPPEQQATLENRAAYTSNQLDYYPAHPRDSSNSYPHDMPVTNLATNPYVMRNAMEARHDKYGIQDEDTINSYYNADSLLEEAFKEMQKKNK